MDQPIRYALLEPSSVMLGEVHTISGDVQLIEQLYADIDPWDVLRQVQAIRSLSRSDPLNYPLTGKESKPVTASASNGEVAGSNSVGAGGGAVGKKGDKNSKLQLKALFDCLMGKDLNDSNTKGVLTSGHSLYVRLEAVFALANWQNERAPVLADVVAMSNSSNASVSASASASAGASINARNINISSKESRDGSQWAGCALLDRALHDLYVDAHTGLPSPCDLTREGSMQLRSALLLALSSIKSLNGITPIPVINTLLLFAENDINEPVEVERGNISTTTDSAVRRGAGGGGGVSSRSIGDSIENEESNSQPSSLLLTTFDDSHVKAVSLLALARIRTENYSKSADNDVLKRVCGLANKMLLAEEATAIAFARSLTRQSRSQASMFVVVSKSVDKSNSDAALGSNFYVKHQPMLALDGAVVAAAIICLAAVDIQATILKRQAKNIAGCYVSKSEVIGPTGVGFVSQLNYASFFAPYNHKFVHIHDLQQAKSHSMAAVAASNTTRPVDYVLSSRYGIATPAVKLAALESFLGLCLVQNDLYHEKYLLQQKQQQQQQQQQLLMSSSSTTATTSVGSLAQSTFVFVAAMIEAVCTLISKETCRITRVSAAQALLDAVQDRPLGRAAFKALALGEPWLCVGFADPSALTLPSYASNLLTQNRRGKSGTYRELFRSTAAQQSVNQLSGLWEMICTESANDQVCCC